MIKLMLIDGNSLLNRAFYAMPLLTAADGRYTNAVYGFTNMLWSAIEQIAPTHIAVAFDRREPTFRHREYADYKAGRKPMPPELVPQFPLLREVLEVMRIPTVDTAGYEADDIIGTLSRICEKENGECVVLSGDKDTLQLVSDKTTVWITRKGISQTEKFTPQYLKESMGLTPEQIIDYKALAGDSSDNIPGISSVGEKTALKLLESYKTAEGVLDNAKNIGGKLGQRIEAQREQALLSKRLATIDRNVPLDFTMQDCIYLPADTGVLRREFELLGFRSLLARLPQEQQEEKRQETREFAKPETINLSGVQGLKEALEDLAKHRQDADKNEVYFIISPDKETGQRLAYISFDEKRQLCIPVCENLLWQGAAPEELFGALSDIISNKSIITYDAKSLMHETGGFEAGGDIMVAEYLLDCLKGDYPLEGILEKYGLEAGACQTAYIAARQQEALKEQGMLELYKNIELPLIGVLYSMEESGFTVDVSVLRTLGAAFGEEMEALSAQIYDMAGETFNINSTKQLGEILFEKLGLPHGRKTKTGYSTGIEVLQALAEDHPIIPAIMEYRKLQKLKSTYIDGMLPLPDATGRVHSSFNQTVTATGRISSTEPNLQNIPVRTEIGREIRRAFVAREGCVLVDGDYSQIELRVLADMSGDEGLRRAFCSGEDVHTATAASVFGVKKEEVTRRQRSEAKAVNFGIVYGISDFGLARNIGVPVKVAAQYIADYFAKYPGVKAFMDRCRAEAKLNGYAVTMMGRRRPCPELSSSNYNTRTFGERVAMNTPVQGSAADIIKLAMVKVKQELQKRNMNTRLILQVHDELILEAPLEEKEAAQQLLKECMEQCCSLSVPLPVECSSGQNWFETK